MALLEFKDNYRSGIDSIDYEHEKLIDLINELHHALAERTSAERVEEILGEMHAKISAHFALEEQMMRKLGFEEYADHSADHHRLLDEILDIMERYAADNAFDYMEPLEAEIRHWFMHHFMEKDAKLHNLMKEKGVPHV